MRKPAFLVILMALAAAAQPPAPWVASKAARVLALQTKTDHVQGIDTDGVHLWVTSVDRASRKGKLQEFTVADGRLERSIEIQDGDRYHPGGIQADANSIWIPIAEYRANSTAIIQQRNKRTLELEFQFAVPDHIGCVAITPEFIIGGNWDSKDFYFWDHKGKLIRKISSETGNAYQDLKVVNGSLVGSGTVARQGAIDWLDLATARLVRRMPIGNTDHGEPLTREGMAIFQGNLWLLPEDGASRLFVLPLTEP